MANIKQLKRKEIRKSIPLHTDDGIVNIEVYNLSREKKIELFNIIQGSIIADGTELNVTDEAVAEAIYRNLTNIEFDTVADLVEVLEDPCYELALAVQEVTASILEIAKEQFQNKLLELEGFEAMGKAGLALKKANDLEQVYTAPKEVVENGEENV